MTINANNSNLYRPDIDGLRTIAILSVVIYHADISLGGGRLFSGGYLGVDVFFVISGYLITSNILRGLDKKQFSIVGFYVRRCRRILPALLFMLFGCLIFCYYVQMPQEYIEASSSAIWALFGLSNFFFFNENPYWATQNDLKPFLHTWSLGVEEQFYVIVPALLLFFSKLGRWCVLLVLILIFIFSLLLNQMFIGNKPDACFYLLPFRMWEMAVGAVLGVCVLKFGLCKLVGRYKKFCKAGSWGALLTILCCLCLFSQDTSHPSFLTLIPVWSTAFLILFCSEPGAVSRLLSTKPFVAVGLLSYSLYLWHQPIFSFGRMLHDSPGFIDKCLWVIVSFALAIVSYFFIECPFRNESRVSSRRFYGVAATACMIFLLGCCFVYSSGGFTNRFDKVQRIYGDAEPDNRLLRAASWQNFNKYGQSIVNAEIPSIFIIGDSHAKDIYNMLTSVERYATVYNFVYAGLSCSVSKDLRFSPKSFKRRIDSKLGGTRLAGFIVSERFEDDEHHFSNLLSLLQCLEPCGVPTALFSKSYVYELPSDLIKAAQVERHKLSGSCHFSDLYFKRNKSLLSPGDVFLWQKLLTLKEFELLMTDSVSSDVLTVDLRLKEMAAAYENIYFVDRKLFLENETRCPLFNESGRKLYFDDNHYTVAGSVFFAEKFDSSGVFGEIFGVD